MSNDDYSLIRWRFATRRHTLMDPNRKTLKKIKPQSEQPGALIALVRITTTSLWLDPRAHCGQIQFLPLLLLLFAFGEFHGRLTCNRSVILS